MSRVKTENVLLAEKVSPKCLRAKSFRFEGDPLNNGSAWSPVGSKPPDSHYRLLLAMRSSKTNSKIVPATESVVRQTASPPHGISRYLSRVTGW